MIGIIGALAPEIEKFNSLLKNARTEKVGAMEYTVGNLGKNEVVTSVCGMGKVFSAVCTQTMIEKYSPSLVINVGAAGTTTNKLHIGNVAIAEKAVQYDMDNSPLGYKKGEIAGLDRVYFDCDEKAVKLLCECAEELGLTYKKAVIGTADLFVDKDEIKKRINAEFGVEVAEMEGASVGQVCTMHGVPYGIIRAISDEAGEAAAESFFSLLDKVVLDAAKFLEMFCERYSV